MLCTWTGALLKRRWLMAFCATFLWPMPGHSGLYDEDEDLPVEIIAAWKVVEIGGKPLVKDSEILIEFEETGTLDGKGTCTYIFGPIAFENGMLRLGPVAEKRRICDAPAYQQEATYLDFLGISRHFLRVLEDDSLILADVNDNILLRLVRED